MIKRQSAPPLPVVNVLPDALCCRFLLRGRPVAALAPWERRIVADLGGQLLTDLLVRGALGKRLPDAELFRKVQIAPMGPVSQGEDPWDQGGQPGQTEPATGLSIPALTVWPSATADGVEGTVLHAWFSLTGGGDAQADASAGAARVAAAVIGVNDALDQANRILRSRLLEVQGEDPSLAGLELIALTPNWLLAAGQEGQVGAGPGVPPAPRADLASDWRPSYRFDGATAAVADGSAGEGVTVAVLDTRPDQAEVAAAAARFDPPHAFLADLATRVQFGGLARTDPALAGLPDLVSRWESPAPAGDHGAYRMPDHGLVVAGLILGAAPEAEVHLLRALSDQGVGDLQTLTALLGQARSLTGAAERKLIVNLSLVAAIPTENGLKHEFRPLREAGEQRRVASGSEEGLETEPMRAWLGGAILDAIAALSADDVLVVASAGNDAAPGIPGRPEPRLPARDDRVLAVAAMGRGRGASLFSNAADVKTFGNGVLAFGGNAKLASGNQEVDPEDALIGAFASTTVPITGEPVQTGWVAWSGTSFAAPLVTALAARLWSQNPGLKSHQVLARVRAMADGEDDAELMAPGLEVWQDLFPPTAAEVGS